MIEIVAGRPVEAERHVLRLRSLLAHQLDRKAPADMRRIEEGAVSAVVDVELVAAALLDAYQHARIFRAQRPARLAPELGRIADRQAFEGLVDHLEIGLERRRLHARIDGRKAPADLDDVHSPRPEGRRVGEKGCRNFKYRWYAAPLK